MAISGSLNFLSASGYGSIGSVNRTLRPSVAGAGPQHEDPSTVGFVPVDFVGLNIVVREPITASENFLGQPSSQNIYNTTVNLGHKLDDTGYYVPIWGSGKAPELQRADPTLFNAIMLNRNGPYQHPSWKQYRGGEHPVARGLRLHNTMSIDVRDPDTIRKEKRKKLFRDLNEYATFPEKVKVQNEMDEFYATLPILGEAGLDYLNVPKLERFYEPSVVIKHKPLLFDTQMEITTGGSALATVRSTFMNDMTFFENRSLNKELLIAGTLPVTASSTTEKDFRSPNQDRYSLLKIAKQYEGESFVYSQMIFPKSVNVFRPYKLSKPNYEESSGYGDLGFDRTINRSFWRDNQPALGAHITNTTDPDTYNRLRTDELAFNSQEMLQHVDASKLWYVAGDSKTFFGYSDGDQSYAFVGQTNFEVVAGGTGYSNASAVSVSGGSGTGLKVNTTTSGGAITSVVVSNSGVGYLLGEVVTVSGGGGNATLRITIGSDVGLRLWKGTTSTGAPAFDVGTWCQPEIFFIEGGVIAERGINSFSGSATSNPIGSDNLPTTQLKAAYVNHETYNPYPPALLSMWPLDARPDLFDGTISTTSRPALPLRGFDSYAAPIYLTSSHGGKGIQIGLTPHRMKEYDTGQSISSNPFVTTNPVFTASHNFDEVDVAALAGSNFVKYNLTASYNQFIEIQTGSAGELAYSTKPTIFFHRSSSYAYNAKGYHAMTASLQYNRHTFPYNTPFYATNKIRQRNPMFNSYADFAKDLKYLGREYSYIPEYRVSDNIEFYYDRYFNDKGEQFLYAPIIEAKQKEASLVQQEHSYQGAIFGEDTSINMVVLKRSISLGLKKPHPAQKEKFPPQTKLNFLRLDGVFGVTSSATNTTFETASFSSDEMHMIL